MKLRIRGNSIRLRLGRSEVERMVQTGVVEESTVFDITGQQRLEYVLQSDPEAGVVSASFDNGRIVVRVPATLVQTWGTTDQVGIEAMQPLAEGASLRILVEKDFECVDAPAHEPQEDAFPRQDFELACSTTPNPEKGSRE